MAVLEIESPSQSLFLYSPNLLALEREGLKRSGKWLESLRKARHFLDEMGDALADERVERFNLAKERLFRVFRQAGTPIASWNPLILTLRSPHCLQGARLPQINLERVRLSAAEGVVSLEGAGLQGARFREADLSRLRLADADLTGADFHFADLREAQLTRALLIEADLSQAKLSLADCNEANLYSARMNGVLARQAHFRKANFRKADLRHADFYQAELAEARFQHADLREASLFMANLSDAGLRHADLRKANFGFCRLIQARLQDTLLRGANFASADLSRSDLRGCRLGNVSLSRARLEGARLSGADFHGADLSLCSDLPSAFLHNARFDGETLFPEGFDPEWHALLGLECRGPHRLLHTLLTFLPHRCIRRSA